MSLTFDPVKRNNKFLRLTYQIKKEIEDVKKYVEYDSLNQTIFSLAENYFVNKKENKIIDDFYLKQKIIYNHLLGGKKPEFSKIKKNDNFEKVKKRQLKELKINKRTNIKKIKVSQETKNKLLKIKDIENLKLYEDVILVLLLNYYESEEKKLKLEQIKELNETMFHLVSKDKVDSIAIENYRSKY